MTNNPESEQSEPRVTRDYTGSWVIDAPYNGKTHRSVARLTDNRLLYAPKPMPDAEALRLLADRIAALRATDGDERPSVGERVRVWGHQWDVVPQPADVIWIKGVGSEMRPTYVLVEHVEARESDRG